MEESLPILQSAESWEIIEMAYMRKVLQIFIVKQANYLI